MTNTGTVVFGAGGQYLFDMEDAVGQPGTNWDFLSISSGLTIQAASTNPFIIKLRSIDENVNDGVPGAADFGANSAQSWVIATTAGITNFSSSQFTVDTSAFANDLAGGSFSVATNGNSLLLVFNPQPAPPTIGNITFDGVNFIVSGSGGVTGGNYYVLTSTNLLLPLSQWQRVATNPFASGGTFSFSNAPAAGTAQVYYRLLLP
jgi:hypothetical protein